MTNRYIQSLKRIDPTTGFVLYVENVKPYHTKILETLVEYVWTEDVDTTIIENLVFDMDFRDSPVIPTVDSEGAPAEIPAINTVYDCGYGIIFDAPGAFPNVTFYIKGVVTGLGGTWVIQGDITSQFTVGTVFVVGNNPAGNGFYTVVSATYNVTTGNTSVVVAETIPAASSAFGSVYYFNNAADIVITSDYATNSITIAGDMTDKYFESSTIVWNSSVSGRNDGQYVIATVELQGPTTYIVLRDRIGGSKPISSPNDGFIRLARPGYDEPTYCRLSQASPLHTDSYISENLKIEVIFIPRDRLIVTDMAEDSQSVALAEGVVVLPTGIDGNYLDLSGLDEDLFTATQLHCQTIVP